MNKTKKSQRVISRRQFIQGVGISLAGSALAACTGERFTGRPPAGELPELSLPILPSPQPPATPIFVAQPGALALDDFLTLSSVLTGVDNLNPLIGAVYLQSLHASSQFEVTPAALYEQAGFAADAPPPTIEDLEASGLFDQEAMRQLADKITEYWYTGVYDTEEGEQAVATFVDALAWQALHFTKPPTICGAPDFWTRPPEGF
jgi:hypothetical protein